MSQQGTPSALLPPLVCGTLPSQAVSPRARATDCQRPGQCFPRGVPPSGDVGERRSRPSPQVHTQPDEEVCAHGAAWDPSPHRGRARSPGYRHAVLTTSLPTWKIGVWQGRRGVRGLPRAPGRAGGRTRPCAPRPRACRGEPGGPARSNPRPRPARPRPARIPGEAGSGGRGPRARLGLRRRGRENRAPSGRGEALPEQHPQTAVTRGRGPFLAAAGVDRRALGVGPGWPGSGGRRRGRWA